MDKPGSIDKPSLKEKLLLNSKRGVAALSLTALAGCGSSEAPAQVTVTETVTATTNPGGEATPTTNEATATRTEQATESPKPTDKPKSLEEQVEEKLGSLEMPEQFMPAISKIESLVIDKESEDYKNLTILYPQLPQEIERHRLSIIQNVTPESIAESQADLKKIFDADFLLVDDDGNLLDESGGIEDISTGYQQNNLIFDIDSPTYSYFIATSSNPSKSIGGMIMGSGKDVGTWVRMARNQNGVRDYFNNHPEEKEGRIRDKRPVQSELLVEDVVGAQFLNQGATATRENVLAWSNAALNPENKIGNILYDSYPVNFVRHPLDISGKMVPTYSITLLSTYDEQGETRARLDSYLFMPHDNGYFDSKDGQPIHQEGDWVNVVAVDTTGHAGLTQ